MARLESLRRATVPAAAALLALHALIALLLVLGSVVVLFTQPLFGAPTRASTLLVALMPSIALVGATAATTALVVRARFPQGDRRAAFARALPWTVTVALAAAGAVAVLVFLLRPTGVLLVAQLVLVPTALAVALATDPRRAPPGDASGLGLPPRTPGRAMLLLGAGVAAFTVPSYLVVPFLRTGGTVALSVEQHLLVAFLPLLVPLFVAAGVWLASWALWSGARPAFWRAFLPAAALAVALQAVEILAPGQGTVAFEALHPATGLALAVAYTLAAALPLWRHLPPAHSLG